MSTNRVEKLVYWYLRFNGYLTVQNFTVHPDSKKKPEAEADIIAVRFPYSREEPQGYPFERDQGLIISNRIDFIIGEVKSGLCDINETWQDENRQNVHYALRWLGFLEDENKIDEIALQVYNQKIWQDEKYCVRFVCFGERENDGLKNQYPELLQVLHQRMVEFICRRLNTNCPALHRENWDSFIQEFANRSGKNNTDKILHWVLRREQ